LSQKEIEESLNLLEKDWDVEPVINWRKKICFMEMLLA
jgi:hypothetical protein